MGDPKYIAKLGELYGVEFGNISDKAQKEILLFVKRILTKKEYKVFFQFMDDSSDEVMKKVNATKEEMEKHERIALRKLKDSKVQNEIIALSEDDNS